MSCENFREHFAWLYICNSTPTFMNFGDQHCMWSVEMHTNLWSPGLATGRNKYSSGNERSLQSTSPLLLSTGASTLSTKSQKYGLISWLLMPALSHYRTCSRGGRSKAAELSAELKQEARDLETLNSLNRKMLIYVLSAICSRCYWGHDQTV